MGDLPSAPPPAPYLQRDRGSLDAVVELFGWLPIAGMVLAVTGVFSFLIGDEIAGPAGEVWGGILWVVGAIVWCAYLFRRFRRRAPQGGPAWERDRAWGRDGEVRSPWRRYSLLRFLLVAAFLLCFGWMMTRRGGVAPMFLYVAAGHGVFAVFAMTRAWLQGGVEVRWPDFPIRTGTRVRFHVATTAGGTTVPRLTASLRCIESRRGAGGRSSDASIVSEVACADPGPLATGPEEFVTVEFDIPADAPGTDLSCRGDERYWELVVLGTTAWGKIAETFVVPIYAVEGADAGAGSA